MYDLFCVLGAAPPSPFVTDLPWENESEVRRLLGDNRCVNLRTEPIDTNVPNVNYLFDANPDMLIIHLPILNPDGQRQGFFGVGSADRKIRRKWQSVATDFLDSTKAGLWGVFPRPVKIVKFDPDFRYGPGVAELWRTGYKLRGAGNDTWHPEEPKRRAKRSQSN
jgi:hypothetical protein